MALKLITAGESHGPGLTCIVEGIPAGLGLDREAVDADMARRQLGHGRGGRMKIERDAADVTGGVRHGRTLGGPIAVHVTNLDFANWEERMNPWPVEADVPEVHLPRPGHADLVGVWKYRQTDVRNILERASARETAARVAGGGLHINVQRKANESIGGVFEVIAFGCVPGLGSHVSWEERLDGRLAGALCSIQAVKGVSLGDAFDVAGRPGSEAHDEIFYSGERGFYRETNHAGGLEGGMTNGEPVIVRGAMKPLPTLTKPLRSVDIATHEPAQALRERTDSSTVPAAGVVGEAMVAFVLADAYRRKFGGDHIDDVREAVAAYSERIGWKPR